MTNEIVTIPKQPDVHVLCVIDGVPQFLLGGLNPPLYDIIIRLRDEAGTGLVLLDRRKPVIGQDIYSVSFDVLMSIRGAFDFARLPELLRLPETWPSDASYYLLVSI